jgi:CheY-like chemotaxis protein
MVDDEPMILRISKRLLNRLGYEVILAQSGQDAIQMLEKYRDDISLIILDMIMPQMGGIDTFERLRQIDPDAKIVISSGLHHDESVDEMLKNGALGFVTKPYDLNELSKTMTLYA